MFERPALLWLLLLAPLIAAPGWLTRRRSRRWALAVATLLRVGCFAVLVVAMAGPVVKTLIPARGLMMVALVDHSRSIAPDQARWEDQQVGRLRAAASPHDQVAVIGFARNAELLMAPDGSSAAKSGGIERGATDIAAALSTAEGLFPAGVEKRVLLLSDGNETQGSALDELPELVDQGVQVYSAAPPPSHIQRIAIDSLAVPNPVRAHLKFALQIAIDSDAHDPVHASLTLYREGQQAVVLPVLLLPGLNHFEIPMRLETPGAQTLRVNLSAPNGLEVVNPRAEVIASVVPPPRVLVASADVPTSLVGALRLRDYQVDERTPDRMPAKAEDYLRYQAVIVDDASAKSLTPPVQEALNHYVGDYGGGLIVTGSTLRDSGFSHGALEDTLPVKFRPQPPPPSRAPLGIYLCIDRSNSMSYDSRYPSIRDGQRIRYAKQAAIALINQLSNSDFVGVIAFDSQPYILARLQPLGADRAELIRKIMSLEPGGGTDFLETLQIAARDLIQSALPVREIVLLTDGDTNRAYSDHEQLMYDLGQEHLPVSTIRIGPDQANLRLLQDFAEVTGGTFYRVQNIEKLPQLFIRLSHQAMHSGPEIHIKADPKSAILRGIPPDKIPPVEFYSVTQPKDGAGIALTIERGREHYPLLAAWQYGLGRSAVFATDPDSLATVAWMQWDHYAQFWSQLIGWTMREGESGPMNLKVTHDSGNTVSIEAEGYVANQAGSFFCRIEGPGTRREVPLTPAAGDIYRADAVSLPPGKYVATLIHRLNGKPHPEVLTSLAFGMTATPPPDLQELRLRPPNLDLLRRLARSSHGAYDASIHQMLQVSGRKVPITEPIAPRLIPLIIGLLLAEVFVRRCFT